MAATGPVLPYRASQQPTLGRTHAPSDGRPASRSYGDAGLRSPTPARNRRHLAPYHRPTDLLGLLRRRPRRPNPSTKLSRTPSAGPSTQTTAPATNYSATPRRPWSSTRVEATP